MLWPKRSRTSAFRPTLVRCVYSCSSNGGWSTAVTMAMWSPGWRGQSLVVEQLVARAESTQSPLVSPVELLQDAKVHVYQCCGDVIMMSWCQSLDVIDSIHTQRYQTPVLSIGTLVYQYKCTHVHTPHTHTHTHTHAHAICTTHRSMHTHTFKKSEFDKILSRQQLLMMLGGLTLMVVWLKAQI